MKRRPNLPVYYSPQEVADTLEVTRRTVYSWIKTGLLLAVKAGPREWRITQEALDLMMKQRELQEWYSDAKVALRNKQLPELAAARRAMDAGNEHGEQVRAARAARGAAGPARGGLEPVVERPGVSNRRSQKGRRK
jgi:excisionase family DNA binding protein